MTSYTCILTWNNLIHSSLVHFGKIQRRPPPRVLHRRIRPLLEEIADHLRSIVAHGLHRRRQPQFILRVHVSAYEQSRNVTWCGERYPHLSCAHPRPTDPLDTPPYLTARVAQLPIGETPLLHSKYWPDRLKDVPFPHCLYILQRSGARCLYRCCPVPNNPSH